MTKRCIAETKNDPLSGIEKTTHASLAEACERYYQLIEQGFLPAIFEGDDQVFHVLLLHDAQP